MNILILSADFSLPPYGGIASHLAGLAPALRELGHQVRIVVPSNKSGDAGVREDAVAGVPVIFLRWGYRLRFWRYLRTILATRRFLRELIRREGIDVVDVQDLLIGPPVARGLRKQVPVVFTNHTSSFTRWSYRWWGRLLLRILIGTPAGVVGGSPLLAERSALLGAMPRESIPCGIDTGVFVPPAAEKGAVPATAQRILFVGRFHPVKGLSVLLRAMPALLRRHPKARLVVAGGGNAEEESRIAAEIEGLGIAEQVELRGRVARELLPSLYTECDIVALPSFMEGTSLTLLEAMACARPIVATAVGGTPAVISDGENGLLTPAGDPEAFAAALDRLLSDPVLARSLGSAARTNAETRYAWPVIAGRVASFYGATIERFRSR